MKTILGIDPGAFTGIASTMADSPASEHLCVNIPKAQFSL